MRRMGVLVVAASLLLVLISTSCGDATPPTTVSNLARATPDNDYTQTFTWGDADDDGSGISHYAISIDGEPKTKVENETSYTCSIYSDGDHTFSVEAVDKAGNHGEAASISFTIDTSTPSAVSDLTKDTLDNDNTPTFIWKPATDHGSGIAYYVVAMDSGSWLGIGDVATYSCDAALSDGTHTFEVKAVDKAGNEGFAESKSFIVDTVAPVISQVDVSGGTIKWLTDEQATSLVEYGITTTYGSTASGEGTSSWHSLDTGMVLTLGTTCHFRVRSMDAAGNEAISCDYSLTAIGLVEAQVQGLIDVVGTGHGLEQVDITVTSESDAFLEVNILCGTIFAAQSADKQSMIVAAKRIVSLHPRETERHFTLDAACIDMYLGTPHSSDNLTLEMSLASGDLLKLVSLAQFGEVSFRVQQFAVWTITENPTRGGYVGIGYFGFGTGPSDDEMTTIRGLFDAAGIDTTKYRALA